MSYFHESQVREVDRGCVGEPNPFDDDYEADYLGLDVFKPMRGGRAFFSRSEIQKMELSIFPKETPIPEGYTLFHLTDESYYDSIGGYITQSKTIVVTQFDLKRNLTK